MARMLRSMTDDELFARLRAVVELQRWSVAVTLTTGDVMIGGIMPDRVPYEDVGVEPYAYYPSHWNPLPDPRSATALWLKEVRLRFPSTSGRGTAICDLAAESVTAIRPLGWKLDAGVPELRGGLGLAIGKANESAAARAGIQTFGFAAASLNVPRGV